MYKLCPFRPEDTTDLANRMFRPNYFLASFASRVCIIEKSPSSSDGRRPQARRSRASWLRFVVVNKMDGGDRAVPWISQEGSFARVRSIRSRARKARNCRRPRRVVRRKKCPSFSNGRTDPVLKARNALLKATQRDFSGWNQFRVQAGARCARCRLSLGFRRVGVVSARRGKKKEETFLAGERAVSLVPNIRRRGAERSGGSITRDAFAPVRCCQCNRWFAARDLIQGKRYTGSVIPVVNADDDEIVPSAK